MSHINNTIWEERKLERYFGKNESPFPIPEKYLINGEPIYSDAYLKEVMDAEFEKELKAQDNIPF